MKYWLESRYSSVCINCQIELVNVLFFVKEDMCISTPTLFLITNSKTVMVTTGYISFPQILYFNLVHHQLWDTPPSKMSSAKEDKTWANYIAFLASFLKEYHLSQTIYQNFVLREIVGYQTENAEKHDMCKENFVSFMLSSYGNLLPILDKLYTY